MGRIQDIFKQKTNKVIPFITAGYPTLNDTIDIVLAAEKAGASMIELGMPFSDPLADGPVIQKSSLIAIENGVTLKWILKIVKNIRIKSEIPIVLMGYINPILSFGMNDFMSCCEEAGVDGLIVPDLPPEEADEFISLSRKYNISPIMLVAPNSTPERIRQISILSGDLIYCVAILGITGSKSFSLDDLKQYLSNVAENSVCPFIVGFGIKNRSEVAEINNFAHGTVVGSAIINEMENNKDPAKAVKEYIEKLTK